MGTRLRKSVKNQIQNICNRRETFIEIKMEFDIVGLKYESDIDIFDQLYHAVGYYFVVRLLKNDNNIDKIFNENLTRKTLYDCWTGGSRYKNPIYRICAQTWLKKHPEFCD